MRFIDLAVGLTLEQPTVTIPWDIGYREARSLLLGEALTRTRTLLRRSQLRTPHEEYIFLPCVALHGLTCLLELRWEDKQLVEARFTRFDPATGKSLPTTWDGPDGPDLLALNRLMEDSFAVNQEHLERTFGPPHKATGEEPPRRAWDTGFRYQPEYEWHFGAVVIWHWVDYWWEVIEHVRIYPRGRGHLNRRWTHEADTEPTA